MGCACSTDVNAYISCAGVPIAQPFTDDGTLMTIAAGAGARSADWTMCAAMAFLKTRRFIYWRVNPGDCGTQAIGLSGLTGAEAQLERLGGGIGGKLLSTPDPTLVTETAGAILSGLSSIFGVFTQAHIQAVQTEETTLCQVSTKYNQFIQQIENAVASGQLSIDNANNFMDQVVQELDPVLAGIAKKCCSVGNCDAACGYRFALRALQTYNEKYVFPGLAPIISALGPITSIFSNPSPPASAGAPGSTNTSPLPGIIPPAPITGGVPTMLPTSVPLPGGNGLIWVGGGLIAAKVLGAI